MRWTFFSLIGLGALCLSACTTVAVPTVRAARPQPVTPAPSAPPVAKPAAAVPAAPAWEQMAVSPGTWAYRPDPQWPVALFGQPGAQASFAVRCDRALRRILLQRAVRQPFDVAAQMTIRSTTAEVSYPTSVLAWAPTYLTVEIAASEPLLDAMAISRGRILISVSGQTPLVLPSWVELTRVIEDCRS